MQNNLKPELGARGPWFDSLSRLLQSPADQQLDDCCKRIVLVAKTKWLILGAFAIYGLFAAASYSLSRVGFCFSFHQTLFLVLTALAVVACNLLVCLSCGSFRRPTSLIHILVAFDLLFVTMLIHFTGGIVSWFWPVYLLVTWEAAFLFDDRRDVWLIGTLGATLYGALLLAEYFHILPLVVMPFVDQSLHGELLFQILMWCWVAGMNAVVAVIAAFLMDTIRCDHRRVKESEEALLGFIQSANDIIFCCDQNGVIKYANQICREMLGFQRNEFGNVQLGEFLGPEAVQQFHEQVDRVVEGGQAGHLEQQFTSRAGESIEVEMSFSGSRWEGGIEVIWCVCRDITDRKQAQQELYKLAHHDILTGLPNRVLLQDRLQLAKALANRMSSNFALLFIDLDRFKIINDTLGHSVGDELLRLVADRLRNTLRETDTIARIGGDEFVILLLNVDDRSDVGSLSEKILKALGRPFSLHGHELFVTSSLGICMYPEDERDTEEMMKKADIAMYHAKALGRNNFQFYSHEMDQNASRRFTISNGLRRGLDQSEFRLYYQPKIDVLSGRIVAMEALVRWQHPELGLLSPMEFIQLAEENGLIMQLGEWVLREACRENMKWQAEGIGDLRVAVNISGYQLQHRSLLTMIMKILSETGINPERLEFEITESVIMQNPDSAVAILSTISDLGIHISIDDFGTGYSSLAHLKRFSVNTIKIDKSFVRDVTFNSTDAAIATAIIAMGNSLNLNVIAEGVETQAQYDFLKENNCDQVQGYLFGKPVPAEEVYDLLRENRAAKACQS